MDGEDHSRTDMPPDAFCRTKCVMYRYRLKGDDACCRMCDAVALWRWLKLNRAEGETCPAT